MFAFGGREWPVTVLNLPSVVESYKTLDDINLVKTTDIGQVGAAARLPAARQLSWAMSWAQLCAMRCAQFVLRSSNCTLKRARLFSVMHVTAILTLFAELLPSPGLLASTRAAPAAQVAPSHSTVWCSCLANQLCSLLPAQVLVVGGDPADPVQAEEAAAGEARDGVTPPMRNARERIFRRPIDVSPQARKGSAVDGRASQGT